MVFHRFLAGEVAGGRWLTIEINGVEVEPWDPFARDESASQALEPRTFEIESGVNGQGVVKFRPFVLPPRELFSSEYSFHRLAGPARWNRQQGFYIYRGDRMIQSGWSYARTADEHTKLARAAIDFAPELDDALRVNVAKARVLLPPDLREQLEPAVAELVRQAQTAYRKHGAGRSQAPRDPSRRSRTGNGARERAPHGRMLERAARRAGELSALRAIKRELRRVSPAVARELGW